MTQKVAPMPGEAGEGTRGPGGAGGAGGPGDGGRVVTAVLAGRQNAGKTSLLMHLTHSAQHPVNFPGTSVERVESALQVGGTLFKAVDLPGIGSLSALSRDEEVALDFLRAERGGGRHVLCAVLDAAKLSVELHLLFQLTKLGLPVVVALNKNDVARRAGRAVDAAALSRVLGLRVVQTNALTGGGVDELRDALIHAADGAAAAPLSLDPDQVTAQVQARHADRAAQTLTDRLDAIFLHRVLGLPIVALILFGAFQLLFTGAEPLVKLLEAGQDALCGVIDARLPRGALRSFLTSGLVKGLGSVFVFVPQIVFLVTLVSILEATGYMARAAFVLDRLLSGVGLSGRSFVPLMTSFGCAVPGVLATRIIDNERDRLATIAVAPLMSCSARLPVYVLLIGAFFPARYAGLMLFGLYALGISLAALVAWLLRGTVLRGERSVLMMELPEYQRPSARVVGAQVLAALREFLALAGTVIFATSILIWALSYYPRPEALHRSFEAQRQAVRVQAEEVERLGRAEDAAYLEQSYLARMGRAIQPVFAPAGFDWRTTIGILAAFPARENIIPTLGVLYSVGQVDAEAYDRASLGKGADPLGQELRGVGGRGGLTPLSALALMVFFALCSQCIGTLATIRRETRSLRWPVFTFVYMTSLAWIFAVGVHRIGTALGWAGT
jgi:ferrous iron transport protein B